MLPPNTMPSAVHFTGRRSAMRARMRLLPGSPQRTRLLLAMSASVTSLSSRTWASPRNWRCHSAMARFSSAAAHCATLGDSGVPVGETKTKLSRKASSMGPCSPWRLCRPGTAAVSTTAHCAPDLRKCAVHERSLPGIGRGEFLAIDRDHGRARDIERAGAGSHGEGEGGDVGSGDGDGRIAGRLRHPRGRAPSVCRARRRSPSWTGCSAA